MAVKRLNESFSGDIEDIIARINELEIGNATEDEIARGFSAIQNAMKSVRKDYTSAQKLISNSGFKPIDSSVDYGYAVGKFNDGSPALVAQYNIDEYYIDIVAGGSGYSDDYASDNVGVSIVIGNDEGDFIEADKNFDSKMDTLKFAAKVDKQISALSSIDFPSFIKLVKKLGYKDSEIVNDVPDFEY